MLSSSLPRCPRAASTKLDTQIAYGLSFGSSSYVQKVKKIIIPMTPVACQNSAGVNRNCQSDLVSRIYLSVVPPFFGPLGRASFGVD